MKTTSKMLVITAFAILLAFSLTAVMQNDEVADAADPIHTEGGLVYTLLSEEDKTVSVRAGTDFSAESVDIPATITVEDVEYSVVSIEKDGFRSKATLKSVTIPEGVTFIGNRAFASDTELTSIVIPDSVTTIDQAAFYKDGKLSAILVGSGVTSIPGDAFEETAVKAILFDKNATATTADTITFKGTVVGGLKGLQLTVDLPDYITEIGAYAFYGNTKITTMDIPESVVMIGNSAFNRCGELTTLVVKDSVKSIGPSAFYNNTKLTDITFNADVSELPQSIFEGDPFKSITIPNSVTKIGDRAFAATGLESITIPDTVTEIGLAAFYNSAGLSQILVGSGVTSIIGDAFKATGVTKIAFDKNATAVTADTITFKGTVVGGLAGIPIESIDLTGTDVTKIDAGAFSQNSALQSITISDTVKEISNQAFMSCTSLDNVTIPSTVTEMGSGLFHGCSSLKNVKIDAKMETIPDSFLRSTSISEFVIDEGVTSIGNRAFASNNELTSIVIPDSVTTIDGAAFYNCPGLSQILVGSGVTSIPSDAFQSTGVTKIAFDKNATAVTADTITFKGTVVGGLKGSVIESIDLTGTDITKIENSAFYNTSLKTVIIPNTCETIGSSAFGSNTGLVSLTLPATAQMESKIGIPANAGLSIIVTDCAIGVGEEFDLNDFLTKVTAAKGWTYESSDSSVATCDNGLVSRLASGDVTITAKSSAETAEAGTGVTVTMALTEAYSVIYDANGGTGDAYSETGIEAGEHSLKTFADTGYTAPEGKEFAGWGADAAATDYITSVTITDADVTVYAIYKDITKYSVTIPESFQNGEITTDDPVSDLDDGDTVTLTITPAEGYKLAELTINGTDVTSEVEDNQYTITIDGANVTVAGSFVAEEVYVTVGSDGADYATVALAQIGEAEKEKPITVYKIITDHNEVITLADEDKVILAEGITFNGKIINGENSIELVEAKALTDVYFFMGSVKTYGDISGQYVIFEGECTIDEDTTYAAGTTVVFKDGATITVTDGATLTLEDGVIFQDNGATTAGTIVNPNASVTADWFDDTGEIEYEVVDEDTITKILAPISIPSPYSAVPTIDIDWSIFNTETGESWIGQTMVQGSATGAYIEVSDVLENGKYVLNMVYKRTNVCAVSADKPFEIADEGVIFGVYYNEEAYHVVLTDISGQAIPDGSITIYAYHVVDKVIKGHTIQVVEKTTMADAVTVDADHQNDFAVDGIVAENLVALAATYKSADGEIEYETKQVSAGLDTAVETAVIDIAYEVDEATGDKTAIGFYVYAAEALEGAHIVYTTVDNISGTQVELPSVAAGGYVLVSFESIEGFDYESLFSYKVVGDADSLEVFGF